jgi:hypothetical protein
MIRDTYLLLLVDEFSKEFIRYTIALLIDFFLGYD